MAVLRHADSAVVGWPLQIACSFAVWPPALVAVPPRFTQQSTTSGRPEFR